SHTYTQRTEIQTDRQKYKQADRQTDRQTDTHTHTVYTGRNHCICLKPALSCEEQGNGPRERAMQVWQVGRARRFLGDLRAADGVRWRPSGLHQWIVSLRGSAAWRVCVCVCVCVCVVGVIVAVCRPCVSVRSKAELSRR
ncbi:hypothetical protein LEMLEM_LOCUS24395, partial [Lemmus lemmus]